MLEHVKFYRKGQIIGHGYRAPDHGWYAVTETPVSFYVSPIPHQTRWAALIPRRLRVRWKVYR